MNFEKLVNLKIIFMEDWIIRIIWTNVLIILFSLLIVTLYPALIAGYSQLHKYYNEEPTTLFKGFYDSFKQRLGKKILLSIIITVFLYLTISNIVFYYRNMVTNEWIFIAGYFVTLSFITMFHATSLYGIVVMSTIPHVSIINSFKVSVFIAGKYFIQTLLIVVTSFTPILLLFSPVTHIVLIFAGVSLPMFIIMILSNNAALFLKEQNETSN